MNVVEAYISFKKQLIIIISGLTGCGKTSVAKRLAKNFKINYIDQNNYYIKDFKNPITMPGDTEINNIYTDDAIDWSKFNDDVNSKKSTGIIINAFTTTNITFEPDIHIHLSISKQKCIENRHKYLTKNKNKYQKEFEEINSQTEKWKFNHLTYPYYLETRKNMDIQNMINVTEQDEAETFNEVWDLIINDYIMPYTKKFTTQNNGKDYQEWKESQTQQKSEPVITPISDNNEGGVHLLNTEEQKLDDLQEQQDNQTSDYVMTLDPTDTLNNDTL